MVEAFYNLINLIGNAISETIKFLLDLKVCMVETFYNLRLEYYHLRKDYMISVLKKEVATLSNKARFIKMVIEGYKKKIEMFVNELYQLKFNSQT